MNIEFLAKNIVSYIEDDVCVVAFSNSKNPDSKKYLILSQSLFDTGEDDKMVSVDFGDGSGEMGCLNGVLNAVVIGPQKITLKIKPNQSTNLKFSIALIQPLDSLVMRDMRRIFEKSEVNAIYL